MVEAAAKVEPLEQVDQAAASTSEAQQEPEQQTKAMQAQRMELALVQAAAVAPVQLVAA